MSDDIDQVSDEIPEWDDAPWRTALLKNLRANNGENLHRLIESCSGSADPTAKRLVESLLRFPDLQDLFRTKSHRSRGRSRG